MTCTDHECNEGHLNFYDVKLVETGFYIFLIFQQFEDMLPNHAKIKSMKKQQYDKKDYKNLSMKVSKEKW